MTRGELYTTPKGTTGRACRHPLHGDAGMVCYLETVGGGLVSVFGVDGMRRATSEEAQRYRREGG